MHILKIFITCITFLTVNIYADEKWSTHFFQGAQYSNSHNFAKAIDEYTKALELSNNKNYFIFIDRGFSYLKNGYENNPNNSNYEMAIKDFTYVINDKESNQEEKSDALWGRSQAYLILGKFNCFVQDINELQKIAPIYANSFEENEEYIIFKMSNRLRFDKNVENAFIKMLVVNKYVKTEGDVVFTSSGMGIIKKNETQTAGKKIFEN